MRRVLKLVKICKSVPARREAKRIRATFTNLVEMIRVLLKVLGGAWGFGLSSRVAVSNEKRINECCYGQGY